MADNIQLNAGTGGATLRTLADTSGVEWPVSVMAYATTIATDANVLQPVSVSNPLPATAFQGGSWIIDSIAEPVIAAQPDPTQLKATIVQPDASLLLATVTLASGSTVAVSQSDPTALKATVDIASGQSLAATQSGSWNVGVTGSVTVAQNTASNLLCTASLASGQTLATVTNVTTVGTITNPVAVTQSGTWAPTLAAGSNLIGKASIGADTSTIYNGTTAITPAFAKITASSSGATAVVAAVTGKKIRVLRWSVSANGAVNIKWQSNTTDLTGLSYLTQYGSTGGGTCEFGHFETNAGEALNINLSASIGVGGVLTYILV